MKPVKWGIISTANIGVAKVIPGMLKSKDLEIVAISSRKKKTAEEWAGKLGIPKAYGSYEKCWPIPRSRPSIIRSPTISMCRSR